MTEEKKAIERITKLYERSKDIDKTVVVLTEDTHCLGVLLNLIEKLKKENEELKNKVIKRDNDIIYLEETAEKEFITKQEVKENYIPKDKIREIFETYKDNGDKRILLEIRDLLEDGE